MAAILLFALVSSRRKKRRKTPARVVYGVRNASGIRARTIVGCAIAAMSGTHSTRVESVPSADFSGPKRCVWHATSGRSTRHGTQKKTVPSNARIRTSRPSLSNRDHAIDNACDERLDQTGWPADLEGR